MSESRASPRTNVSWRGAIQVQPGNIIAMRILNFSDSGLQVLCSQILRENQTYQIMIEVPDLRDASSRTQVVCKAKCMYSILSGSEYRIGMKYFDIPSQHHDLILAWGGKLPDAA